MAGRGELDWSSVVDVAVVGGGGAGMAAAISAASTSPEADVLLLQKLPELGGTTTISMGSFVAADTSMQADLGIEDSPEAHSRDLDRFVEHAADPSQRHPVLVHDGDIHERDDRRLRQLLVDNAAETLDWLIDLGCEYIGPYWEPPHRVPRLHQIVPDTEAYAAVLGDALADLGVEVRLDTRVDELVTTDGRVIGLHAEGPEGHQTVRAEDGVVLATGDYHSSRELRAEYSDTGDISPITEFNTGDGHRMAAAAGAELTNMDIQWLFLRMGPPLYTAPNIAGLVADGAIVVDADGQRYINETADYHQLLEATTTRPEEAMYVVFDDAIASGYTEWPNYLSTFGKDGKMWAYVDEYLEYDGMERGNTLQDLAGAVGFDRDDFEATIERYREGIEVGGTRVDPMGRETNRSALDDPPFYSLGPVHPVAGSTEGGVAVTSDMAAVAEAGEPIPGLFVAGTTAGGVHLFGHGHHHAWIFTSGRIAGRTAAASST